ncbi:putative Splicing regulatory glutamine-lysine-rich protein, partial [Naja naja]
IPPVDLRKQEDVEQRRGRERLHRLPYRTLGT